MKKPTWIRLGLGLLQHMALTLAVVTVLILIQSSSISYTDMYERRYTTHLNIFTEKSAYEDTAAFQEMFSGAVNDLTAYVVIRQQMETKGVYDPQKPVDVTAFVNRKSQVSKCPITVTYSLGDLLKWNRYGVEYVENVMTKEEFVRFFGDDLLGIDHFYLDEETGMLKYIGSRRQESSIAGRDSAKEQGPVGEEQAGGGQTGVTLEDAGAFDGGRAYVGIDEKLMEAYANYRTYNEEELIEKAFDYLVKNIDKTISVVTAQDGSENVKIQLLVPRYTTTDGVDWLTKKAENWVDYCLLEANVVKTIADLSYNYDLYETMSKMYGEGCSNLEYLYAIPVGEEGREIYSNLPAEYVLNSPEEVTEYFDDLGRYFVYSTSDLETDGNMALTGEEMSDVVRSHEYAYPDGSRIWIGVNTGYPVRGDQFAAGYQTFTRLSQHLSCTMTVLAVCGLVWLVLFLYLTATAGRAWDEDGEAVWYLNGFDRVFTEIVLAIGIVMAVIGVEGFAALYEFSVYGHYYPEIVEQESLGGYRIILSDSGFLYLCVYGAVYGFMASMCFNLMWYSLVRRIRSHNLWRDSLLHWIWEKFHNGATMVVYHKSTAVRTLIPYNMFLIVNLCGVVASLYFRGRSEVFLLGSVGATLVFDAMTGVFLFRRNAEMAEIVDTIQKIRQGEVDCQVESERMHGENREIAEAVNNIGEGIRSAVATSVKDERMKSDLITNVSHDIKTPLTSIINYVDLLKRQHIEEEPAKSYIEILETKAQRLKQLTDDLVEASKISSGNIVLQKEKLNLSELINQSIGEFSEKFEDKRLQVIFSGTSCAADIYADSRRMWRIIENLFNNICKYAMPSTRVYIDLTAEEKEVELSVKNISEYQMNKVKPEELTERFIRGDVSRTTEGSGLGLSIAKSLTEVQGGTLEIILDGDLFKVVIRFPEYIAPIEELLREEEVASMPQTEAGNITSPSTPSTVTGADAMPQESSGNILFVNEKFQQTDVTQEEKKEEKTNE